MGDPGKSKLKKEEDIGILMINNPPENYLESPEFIKIEELKSIIDTGIKALVVSGTGRHFSAGADLKSIKKQIKKVNLFQKELEKGNELLNELDDLDIPVIAAISGVCFGAGLEIALACDIRIAEENTLFSFPEINQDLMPGLSGVRRLIELTGRAVALELILDGDIIPVEKANYLEIIDKLVPKKEAFVYSLKMAKKMTANRPLHVINSIMKSVNFAKTHTREESIKHDAEQFSLLALKAFQADKD